MLMNAGLKIVVMLGGPSAEREVSLNTGRAVAQALRSLGHQVTELDPKPGQWELPASTEVVFLALHGSYGEDGSIQEELENLGVPYTGCGVEASRLAFDKVLAKQRFTEHRIPTARYEVLRKKDSPWPAGWLPPVILKPVRQGSSVGLQFVRSLDQWSEALAASLQHDTEVLMEELIVGRETTVGILDGQALPIVEVRPRSGAYDYQNKYTAGATEYFCPADFGPEVAQRIKTAALGAFRSIGGRDYSRVDVMVRANGDPVVLEVNTLPGMTGTSLLPKAAAAAGIPYGDLCQRMVDMAMRRAS
ncbi:MAG: D-alanine--D-alanine ligase [Verrucomicrobia bacterium]|nr:D-alanine--D-alanine ligase [Verrucomicrobiota bacterium]